MHSIIGRDKKSSLVAILGPQSKEEVKMQDQIGKSAVVQNSRDKLQHEGEENSTLSKLSSLVIEIFSQDNTIGEEFMNTARMMIEDVLIKRRAISLAYSTKEPEKMELPITEYFEKYFDIKPNQTTREIARAKIQSQLSATRLNNSCLDEFERIAKKHNEELMFNVYDLCRTKLIDSDKPRITKKLIHTLLQESLESPTEHLIKEHQSTSQLGGLTVKEIPSPTESGSRCTKPENPHLGGTMPALEQPKTTHASVEKQGKKIIQTSKPRRKTKLPPLSKSKIAANKLPKQEKQVNPQLLDKPLDSISDKLGQGELPNRITEQTFKFYETVSNKNGDIRVTKRQIDDLLMNRADILFSAVWFATLLEKFQKKVHKKHFNSPESALFLESVKTLRKEFIDEIKELTSL